MLTQTDTLHLHNSLEWKWEKNTLSETNDQVKLRHIQILTTIKADVDKWVTLWDGAKKQIQEAFDYAKDVLHAKLTFKEAKDLTSEQIQELLNAVKWQSEISVEIKEESKEKTQELKLDVELSAALWNHFNLSSDDVKRINITSFVKVYDKVAASWTKDDWKKAWYDKVRYFDDQELKILNELKNNSGNTQKLQEISAWHQKWYPILGMLNTSKVLQNNWPEKVLDSVFDFNADGKVDTKDDQNFIWWANLKKFIHDNPAHKQKIVETICDLLSIADKSNSWLHSALISNPWLKYDLYAKLYNLGMTWVDLGTMLVRWKKSIWENIANFWERVLTSEKVAEAMLPGFDAKFDEVVAKLDKEKDKELIAYYVANKPKFKESFKLNGAALALSLIEGHKWLWLWTSLNHANADKKVQELSRGILSWVQLNLWFAREWGNFVPGVWVNLSSREFQLWKDVDLSWNAWFFLNVPYATGTLNYNYNAKALQDMWLRNFSGAKKSFWVTWNISTLANWITLHWSKDRLAAFENKTKSFQQKLDGLFNNNMTHFDKSALEAALQSSSDINENDKKYISGFIEKMEETFKLIWFDTLPSQSKIYALAWIKRALLNQWRLWVIDSVTSKKLEFTGLGLWLQFVAGFVPLPTLWARWSRYGATWGGDVQANVSQINHNSADTTATEAETPETKNMSFSPERFNSEVNTYLSSNLSKFDGSNWSSPIAMRNPRDYPKFLEVLKAWETDNAFIILTSILRTDPVLRNDKATKTMLKSLTQVTTEQKAYVVAQFMDVMFKDKNSIKTVLTTDDLWQGRENWLRWVYNDDAVFQSVRTLRNDVRWSLNGKYSTTDYKNVLWFVASYKIGWKDGKAFSLWKWEAAIPPGLATIVWEKKDVTANETLKNHVLKNLESTPFKANLQSSLAKLIWVSSLSDGEFTTLVSDGNATIDWKNVQLDRKFVFFLYGRCANETLWLEINSITINGKTVNTEVWINGWITINNVMLEKKDYTIWAIGGSSHGKITTKPWVDQAEWESDGSWDHWGRW